MIDISRILCPVDFSEFSERALAHANRMAAWFGSQLTVLHVLPPVPSSTVSHLGEMSRRLATRHLQALVERNRVPGVEVDVNLLESNEPVERILERADALDADLIVMGSHGRKGLPRIVLGSVVEGLLHRSGRPLLIVPSHVDPARAQEPVSFARILCAVDFAGASLTALAHAFAIAEESDAKLSLLHVIEVPPELQKPPQAPDFDVDRVRAEAEAECLTKLDTLIPEQARDYCTVRTEVAEGGVSRQVLRTAAAEHADLIVMGVHGRGALDLLVFGSNTSDIIRQAPCPVLVVPARPVRSALHAAS